MGGPNGKFYDRDVTDKRYRSSSGASSQAEKELSQSQVDPDFLPKNRRLICEALNPLVYLFDVTGSMDKLPKIIYDKWPGIVGQIIAREYLPDPKMSIAAVGDITSDKAPLQMTDFSVLRNLDRYFKKIFFEGNGGGQDMESYEVAAYYYAYLCDLPKAENPICLFTGDEGFRKELYADDLEEHFGGQHKDTTAQKVFSDLSKKFKGNALLIHRYYGRSDSRIVQEWREVLGQDKVILMPRSYEGDLAIGDITLGVYAILSGARTLEQYLEDMRTRPLDLAKNITYEPQSEERIQQVKKALQPLKDFKPVKPTRTKTSGGTKKTSESKTPKSRPKSANEKSKSWKL
jgi:hypothetical protein